MNDLREDLVKQKTPKELVLHAWNTSEKNMMAKHYVAGIIDSLRWSEIISLSEYKDLYELIGM